MAAFFFINTRKEKIYVIQKKEGKTEWNELV